MGGGGGGGRVCVCGGGGWGEGDVAFALSISVAAIGNHFAFRNQLTSRASVVHLDLNVHLGMLQRWQLLRAFVATISTPST